MPKGKVIATDEEIVTDYQAGRFIRQIVKTRKTSIRRVRQVLDAQGMRR